MLELMVPTIDDQMSIGQIANGRLPLVAILELAPLDDASARKAQKCWLQVGQFLYEVGTQAVRPIVPGRFGTERHEIHVDASSVSGRNDQPRVAIGFAWL